MNRTGKATAALVVTLAATASPAYAARPHTQVGNASCRIVTVLPRFGTGDNLPAAVNRWGTVVGKASRTPSTAPVPVMWRSGVPRPIPLPAGYATGGALDINDRGQVVGNLFDETGTIRGYAYDGTSVRLLPLLAGGGYSYARRINATGQIAGMAASADGTEYAVRWDSPTAAPVALLPVAGDNGSFAKGINDLGYVAGDSDRISDEAYQTYAAVWSPSGGVRVYAGAGGAGTEGEIFEINERGTAAGDSATRVDYSDPAFAMHATVWSASGRPADLGVLPGDNFSRALGLSAGGEVVGASAAMDYSTFEPVGVDHAFYWSGHGPLAALPTPERDSASIAHQITDWGVILGQYTAADSPTRGLLWHC